jgi:hypothetical protein
MDFYVGYNSSLGTSANAANLLDGFSSSGTNYVKTYGGAGVWTSSKGTATVGGFSWSPETGQTVGPWHNGGTTTINLDMTIGLQTLNDTSTSQFNVNSQINLTLTAYWTDGPDSVSFVESGGGTLNLYDQSKIIVWTTGASVKITCGGLVEPDMQASGSSESATIDGNLIVENADAQHTAYIKLNNGNVNPEWGTLTVTHSFAFYSGTWYCDIGYGTSAGYDKIVCGTAYIGVVNGSKPTLSITIWGTPTVGAIPVLQSGGKPTGPGFQIVPPWTQTSSSTGISVSY